MGGGGAMTHKFELDRDFCAMHLPPKFHHPKFTRSEVIVLTHKQTQKQTPPKTSNVLRYAMTLGNEATKNIVKSFNHRFLQ